MARITSITDQLERARKDLEGNFRQFVLRIDNLMMDLERRGGYTVDQLRSHAPTVVLEDLGATAKVLELFRKT